MPSSFGAAVRWGVLGVTVALSQSVAAAVVPDQGTWVTSLEARDINGDGAADAYYDKVLDVSWYAQANLTQAAGFPYPRPIINYSDARETVGLLDVYGVSGWRLPTVVNIFDPLINRFCASGADTRVCGANPNPSYSELAYMYYVTLGNGSGARTNDGPFAGISTDAYWTQTRAGIGTYYWAFDMGNGSQAPADPFGVGVRGTWAVHDGAVGVAMPVPEPESMVTLAIGLAAAFGLHRRRRVGVAKAGRSAAAA